MRAGNPEAFFVLNGDVCADFPLSDLIDFHNSFERVPKVTIMATEAAKYFLFSCHQRNYPLMIFFMFKNSFKNDSFLISRSQSLNFGCIVEDQQNHSMLHYVEKPKTYISSLVNCGVYIFSPDIFNIVQQVFHKKQATNYA